LGARAFFRFHALEDQIKGLPSVTEAWFFDSKEKWGNPSTTEMRMILVLWAIRLDISSPRGLLCALQ